MSQCLGIKILGGWYVRQQCPEKEERATTASLQAEQQKTSTLEIKAKHELPIKNVVSA
jgi:hypothetical protein